MTRRGHGLLLLSAAALSLVPVARAAAQERARDVPAAPGGVTAAAPGTEERDENGKRLDELSITLRGTGSLAFKADLKDSPGRVAVSRAGAGIGVGTPVAPETRLNVNLDFESSFYDFSNASALVPGSRDPFDDAYAVSLAPTIFHRLSPEWTVFGGGIFRWSAESGADLSSAVTAGGIAGATWTLSDRLALSFGVAASSRLDDHALVVPIVGVDWKIGDDLRLASEGLGFRLTKTLDSQWSISLAGRWELRDFRLRDDGPLPEGVVRDSRAPVEVALAWSPSRAVTVRLAGGAIVWQEFRFDDREGNRVSEDNTRPTPFVGLTASIAF
ncbi:MAG: hypothetical protein JNM07_04145 [Phycisphaerae bacterium]|nr:hypothetical protein [Phycisphaerae bacterium]